MGRSPAGEWLIRSKFPSLGARQGNPPWEVRGEGERSDERSEAGGVGVPRNNL